MSSSSKPHGAVYDAVQKEFEKKMQKLSISTKKKTKKDAEDNLDD
jgi:stress-induced morphogen